MPEISRFYGIVVRMYYDDHPPPHFHAYYGEYEALINVQTLAAIAAKGVGIGHRVGAFASGRALC